jgi:hypothetical protein
MAIDSIFIRKYTLKGPNNTIGTCSKCLEKSVTTQAVTVACHALA